MVDSLEERFVNELNENAGIVHRICRIYFRNEDDRQDAFQEIVYQLWKSYGSFKGQSKFSTWMYRVALNTAITHIRKSKRDIVKPFLDNQYLQYPDGDDDTEEESVKLLYMAIDTLTSIDKAITLLYLDDHSYEEIASITGLTKTNVSVRLFRIKKRLEEQLKTH